MAMLLEKYKKSLVYDRMSWMVGELRWGCRKEAEMQRVEMKRNQKPMPRLPISTGWHSKGDDISAVSLTSLPNICLNATVLWSLLLRGSVLSTSSTDIVLPFYFLKYLFLYKGWSRNSVSKSAWAATYKIFGQSASLLANFKAIAGRGY
jgi:hypothetical protein